MRAADERVVAHAMKGYTGRTLERSGYQVQDGPTFDDHLPGREVLNRNAHRNLLATGTDPLQPEKGDQTFLVVSDGGMLPGALRDMMETLTAASRRGIHVVRLFHKYLNYSPENSGEYFRHGPLPNEHVGQVYTMPDNQWKLAYRDGPYTLRERHHIRRLRDKERIARRINDGHLMYYQPESARLKESIKTYHAVHAERPDIHHSERDFYPVILSQADEGHHLILTTRNTSSSRYHDDLVAELEKRGESGEVLSADSYRDLGGLRLLVGECVAPPTIPGHSTTDERVRNLIGLTEHFRDAGKDVGSLSALLANDLRNEDLSDAMHERALLLQESLQSRAQRPENVPDAVPGQRWVEKIRMGSRSRRGLPHFLWLINELDGSERYGCTCEDYKYRAKGDPEYTCRHLDEMFTNRQEMGIRMREPEQRQGLLFDTSRFFGIDMFLKDDGSHK